MSPSLVLVALGSNLGDREGYLARARQRLAALPETSLQASSTIEETEPVGPVKEQPRFLNQMVLLDTGLSPRGLLESIRVLENHEGRDRSVPQGPRTLDLDIVWFQGENLSEPDLRIPHPALGSREFWEREIEELVAAVPELGESYEG